MLKKKYTPLLVMLIFTSMVILAGCSSSTVSDLGKKEANVTLDQLEYAYENNDFADVNVMTSVIDSLGTISDKSKIKEVNIKERSISLGPNKETATAAGVIMVTAEKAEDSANAQVTVELENDSDNGWEIANDPLAGVTWATDDEKDLTTKEAKNIKAAKEVVNKFFTAYKNQATNKLKETLIPEIDGDNLVAYYDSSDNEITTFSPYRTEDFEYKGINYTKDYTQDAFATEINKKEWQNNWSFASEYKKLAIDVDNISLDESTAVCTVDWEIKINGEVQTKTTTLLLYKHDGSWYIQQIAQIDFGLVTSTKNELETVLTDWVTAYKNQNATGLKGLVDGNSIETIIDNSPVVSTNTSDWNVKKYEVEGDYNNSSTDIGDTSASIAVDWSMVLENTSTGEFTEGENTSVINLTKSSDKWQIVNIGLDASGAWFNSALLDENFETGDLSKYNWDLAGAANPYVQNTTVYNGTYSLQFGDITHDQTSEISITVDPSQQKQLSFYYKVSSESWCDYLQLYIDGNLVDEWAGVINWTQYSTSVSSGSHTITWIYAKDGSVSNNQDTAWIDDIVLQ